MLDLDINKIERAPGVWKMNAATIQSVNFQESIEHIWPEWVQMIDDYDCIINWWEVVKCKIKQLSIEISRSLNPSKRTVDKNEKRINEIKDSNDPKHKHEYSCLKSKIEEFYENQLKAAKIRSRIKEFEEGERSTKFFLNTEKKE